MRSCFEKLFTPVAQAFQPVSRKRVRCSQPGKAVPPEAGDTEARPTNLCRLHGQADKTTNDCFDKFVLGCVLRTINRLDAHPYDRAIIFCAD